VTDTDLDTQYLKRPNTTTLVDVSQTQIETHSHYRETQPAHGGDHIETHSHYCCPFSISLKIGCSDCVFRSVSGLSLSTLGNWYRGTLCAHRGDQTWILGSPVHLVFLWGDGNSRVLRDLSTPFENCGHSRENVCEICGDCHTRNLIEIVAVVNTASRISSARGHSTLVDMWQI